MKDEIILEAKNINKSFNIETKAESLLSKVLKIVISRPSTKKIEVLKEINLKISKNEIIGILGKNGSGKSTLLKILANIYKPDTGIIKTNANATYLAGWGQGLQQRLAVRENIALIGSINGLSQKEIKKKFKDIIDFAGLTNFEDAKVEHLSSGMITRLTFSIGIHCLEHKKPELLFLDEVFSSGGDLEFQEKALKRMAELIKSGVTVLLVTHNLDLIKEYCNKAIWIDKGQIKREGNSEEVIKEYRKSLSKNF
jgi:ABC-type polysaccharide/polyol phosphate transport system ATPase subunit